MAESPRSNRPTPASDSKPEIKIEKTETPETPDPIVVGSPKADTPVVPKTGDVPDPRTASDTFKEGDQAGFKGRSDFEIIEEGAPAVAFVDPDRIPADVTPAVQPNAGGNNLLAAAQAKAPNLTAEFVSAYEITDQMLADIANGLTPPPPAIGPAHTSDLYLTPGGWVQTAPGVSLAAHAAQQADRRR
jgi:hypothetical protein